jgi:hypothetical protein
MASVAELAISPKHVSVFIPQENTEDSGFATSQNDVVVFIDLFETPARTPKALNLLCKAIVEKVQELDLFKEETLIKCSCRPINRQNGFWSSEMETAS